MNKPVTIWGPVDDDPLCLLLHATMGIRSLRHSGIDPVFTTIECEWDLANGFTKAVVRRAD